MKDKTKTAIKQASEIVVPALIVGGAIAVITTVSYNKHLAKNHDAYTAYLQDRNNIFATEFVKLFDEVIKQNSN